MAKYWIKHTARFIVWICGLFFALMGILGQIPVMPQYALQMMIVLYIFIIASLIMFVSGIEKLPGKPIL